MYIFTTFIVVNTINEIFVVAFDLQVFFTLVGIFVVEMWIIASKYMSNNQEQCLFVFNKSELKKFAHKYMYYQT